jgi:hypothetical protein
LERRLRASALLARRVEHDYLVLDDAVLTAAIEGSAPLGAAQAQALLASPLTLRRFRHLADQRRARTTCSASARWQASEGMLRAADDGAQLTALETDDGHWALHFLPTGESWQVVLKLDAQAPFAAGLLGEGTLLEVRDGAGGLLLQGCLDRDGECEQAWPFEDAPAPHFQRHGARFAVVRASAGVQHP